MIRSQVCSSPKKPPQRERAAYVLMLHSGNCQSILFNEAQTKSKSKVCLESNPSPVLVTVVLSAVLLQRRTKGSTSHPSEKHGRHAGCSYNRLDLNRPHSRVPPECPSVSPVTLLTSPVSHLHLLRRHRRRQPVHFLTRVQRSHPKQSGYSGEPE